MSVLRRAVFGLATAAILAATPAVSADAPPNPRTLELAKKLFAEMHMDQMMEQTVKSMVPAMTAQMRQSNPSLTEAQVQVITQAVTEATVDMNSRIKEKILPLYASTFTEKELQDLADFYGTPSGQAMIAKMPVMMSHLGPIMGELMPEMTADVTKRLCAKLDCGALKAPAKPVA